MARVTPRFALPYQLVGFFYHLLDAASDVTSDTYIEDVGVDVHVKMRCSGQTVLEIFIPLT